MIRDFWVKNYLSIRDKQELSFLAKGPSSELVAEVADGEFLYKLGILYGSNASGKSNMLLALNEVFHILVSPKSDATKKIDSSIPFVLTKNEPIEMHVSFFANSIRYDYDVKFNEKYILNEVLHYYPNKSKSLFYERSFVGENLQADIKFGDENKGPVEILKNAYNEPKKRKFYNTMLQKADLNIVEYRPIVEDSVIPAELREHIKREFFSEKMKDKLLKPTVDSVAFVNHSVHGDFDVSLKWQSKGTLKYIRILDALYDMITGSHVYYLDELGENLHNDLLYFYLNVFIFNSDKSQLIITSQETTLLSQDLINENRGVVWFVDKNKETASSTYSRGDSFGLHKNLSLYNSYRIGRLGAKPELGSIFINLDD